MFDFTFDAMPSQSKYIVKGLIRTILLIAAIGAIYYGMNIKNKPEEKQPEISSYDELMKTPQITNGKVLFDKNCKACHSATKPDDPTLNKIVDSTYDKKTLYAWIRNGDSVLKSGNVYYNNLVEKYNHVGMTSFPNLTDSALDEIMLYIKAEIIHQQTPKH